MQTLFTEKCFSKQVLDTNIRNCALAIQLEVCNGRDWTLRCLKVFKCELCKCEQCVQEASVGGHVCTKHKKMCLQNTRKCVCKTQESVFVKHKKVCLQTQESVRAIQTGPDRAIHTYRKTAVCHCLPCGPCMFTVQMYKTKLVLLLQY